MATLNINFHRSAPNRQTLWISLVLLWSVFLLSGCRSNPEDPNQPTPDILATLPMDWIVVYNNGDNPWIQVNIDDDTELVEYLLFYTYNNSGEENSGPTGASIFDLQNNSELVPRARIVSMPYQPSGSYAPYRVLPNYWKGSGTGFIAPTGRQGNLSVTPITRSQTRDVPVPTPTPDPEATPNSETTPKIQVTKVPVKELLIEDGGQTITVVWWRNLLEGYGAANAHAAAGFKNQEYEQENNAETPLVKFSGFHPFNDRSELCFVTLYEREYVTQKIELQSGETVERESVNMYFAESPRGIGFCRGIPAAPFYPEAVVLKFLLDANTGAALLDPEMANKNGVAVPLAEAIRDESKRVVGLYGPSLIRFDNRDGSPATVCLAVVDVESEKPEAYRFRLNHVEPDVDARTTDQFTIIDVQPIPAPPNGPAVDCNQLVEDGTPGRVPIP